MIEKTIVSLEEINSIPQVRRFLKQLIEIINKEKRDDDIDAILALIPNQATPTNQLADKAFVNSSISTNTATFKNSTTNANISSQLL